MQRHVSIHFSDNTPLHDAHEATYLDNMNHTVNLSREVSQRIQDTKRTWKKLSVFWNDASTNRKWQLLIFDAVVKSRLLYNLETVHLTKSLRQKLDAFHLRGSRKKLKLPTAYFDRRFSNARDYDIATSVQYYDTVEKRVRPISEELDDKRIWLTGHILRSTDTDPRRQVSYKPGSAAPLDIGKRRVGRPRQQWLYQSNALVHSRIRHILNII